MKAALHSLKDRLLYPFKNDLLYFVLLWSIISLPAFYQKLAYPEYFSSTLVLIFYAVTYIVVFLLNLNQYAAKILKPIVFVLYTVLSIVNIYCIYMYNCWFSNDFIEIIKGTNIDEAKEYLEAYITVKMIVLAILFLLAAVILYKLTAKIRLKPHNVVVSLAFMPLLVMPIRIRQHPDVLDVVFTGRTTWNYDEIVSLEKYLPYQTQYWRRITFTHYNDIVDYQCRKSDKINSILHISDTHGEHRRLGNLPAADVIVHSGDFTMGGKESEIIDFLNWFCDLPYQHKIFVCGNHEESLYGKSIEGLDSNVYYLCNSGVEIGGIKFYGVPMFMKDCISGQQYRNYVTIPDDTDVLITHEPPYGIFDFGDNVNFGSQELLERVITVSPCLHLFGHIHCQGITDNGTIRFSNGAIMNIETPNFHTLSLIEE